MMVPTYLVHLAIRCLTPRSIVVLAHAGEPYVLLGRDILNHHRLVLDGPRLALEID